MVERDDEGREPTKPWKPHGFKKKKSFICWFCVCSCGRYNRLRNTTVNLDARLSRQHFSSLEVEDEYSLTFHLQRLLVFILSFNASLRFTSPSQPPSWGWNPGISGHDGECSPSRVSLGGLLPTGRAQNGRWVVSWSAP